MSANGSRMVRTGLWQGAGRARQPLTACRARFRSRDAAAVKINKAPACVCCHANWSPPPLRRRQQQPALDCAARRHSVTGGGRKSTREQKPLFGEPIAQSLMRDEAAAGSGPERTDGRRRRRHNRRDTANGKLVLSARRRRRRRHRSNKWWQRCLHSRARKHSVTSPDAALASLIGA